MGWSVGAWIAVAVCGLQLALALLIVVVPRKYPGCARCINIGSASRAHLSSPAAPLALGSCGGDASAHRSPTTLTTNWYWWLTCASVLSLCSLCWICLLLQNAAPEMKARLMRRNYTTNLPFHHHFRMKFTVVLTKSINIRVNITIFV